MKIDALSPSGIYLLTPEPTSDERGFFARSFSRDALLDLGLETDFPEWSISFNLKKNTLRGLHFQIAPHAETKLVRCVHGAVFDVAVDIREGSPTFGHRVAVELSAGNRQMIYIPKGFAHGFQTLTDDAELLYHISERYQPDAVRGIRWNDPELAIPWPAATDCILSERDMGLPSLAEFCK